MGLLAVGFNHQGISNVAANIGGSQALSGVSSRFEALLAAALGTKASHRPGVNTVVAERCPF